MCCVPCVCCRAPRVYYVYFTCIVMVAHRIMYWRESSHNNIIGTIKKNNIHSDSMNKNNGLCREKLWWLNTHSAYNNKINVDGRQSHLLHRIENGQGTRAPPFNLIHQNNKYIFFFSMLYISIREREREYGGGLGDGKKLNVLIPLSIWIFHMCLMKLFPIREVAFFVLLFSLLLLQYIALAVLF